MAWSTSIRASRLPANWQALRKLILERDGYQCTRVENGQRCERSAQEVDHINPGDNHHPTNLASLCREHHAEKTKHEAATARWRYRNQREPETHPGLK